MPGPIVFDFEITPEAVLSRLSRRLQCPQCRRIFSSNENAHGPELVCDRDGAKLMHRADDNPTTIVERLRLHQQNAAELSNYYSRGEYHRIDASRTPAEISENLLRILNSGTSKKAPARQTHVAAQAQYLGI
jgi:adenylate kinase